MQNIFFKKPLCFLAGEYNVVASNSAGRKSCDVKVAVVGKPGPIDGRLNISELTAEFAVLSWNPPIDNGGWHRIVKPLQYYIYKTGCCVGSEITNYVVEKRDTMNGNWVNVTSSIARTTCRVSGLLGGNEYTFRVMAENRHGISSPVLSDTVIARYPFGMYCSVIKFNTSEQHLRSEMKV